MINVHCMHNQPRAWYQQFRPKFAYEKALDTISVIYADLGFPHSRYEVHFQYAICDVEV